MGFDDRDRTVSRDICERTRSVRIERNCTITPDGLVVDLDPPATIHVAKDFGGQAIDLRVPDEAVAANWDGPTKTLEAWVLASIDAAE